jgi:5'-nucleotidase
MRGVLLAMALLSLLPATALAEGLDILLTNDDGWDATGIQTMKDALEAAGHNVVLVAPLTNQSGQSAALTLALVSVIQQSANEFAVDGSPATCVLLALSAILAEPPDLIVSGTNDGANIGNTTSFSGTVGAATAGIIAEIPSLAFSTDPPTDDPTDPAFQQHFVNVADFAARLIAHLQTTPGSLNASRGLLPRRLGLNVNYPPLTPAEVQGIQLSVQGRVSTLNLVYVEVAPGLFVPALGPAPPAEPDVKDSDVDGFEEGFITIVPIDADYTARPGERNPLESVVNGLTP